MISFVVDTTHVYVSLQDGSRLAPRNSSGFDVHGSIFRYRMGPDLLFITLLGLTITVHGQTPSPEQPSITTFLPDLIPKDLPAPGTLPPPDDGVVEPTPLNTQPAVKEAKPTGGPLAGNMEVHCPFSSHS